MHPKILKNLYDLLHERYLQKCHTTVNIGMTLWIAFLGGVVTYLLEGGGEYNDFVLVFILIGTSIICSLSLFFYRLSKHMRNEVLKDIKRLNHYAKDYL